MPPMNVAHGNSSLMTARASRVNPLQLPLHRRFFSPGALLPFPCPSPLLFSFSFSSHLKLRPPRPNRASKLHTPKSSPRAPNTPHRAGQLLLVLLLRAAFLPVVECLRKRGPLGESVRFDVSLQLAVLFDFTRSSSVEGLHGFGSSSESLGFVLRGRSFVGLLHSEGEI